MNKTMHKMMKTRLLQWMAFFVFATSATVQADTVADAAASTSSSLPKMLIYIQPVEYSHPIRLWRPYQDYWYEQGPLVEALALEKLGAIDSSVAMCEGNQSGKSLIWLQPTMFYNPQMQVFYGEIVANVYTGAGKLVAAFKGVSNVRGTLNREATERINSAYAQAMDNMVVKLQADTALQARLNDDSVSSVSQATPCSMVTLLPTRIIRNVSF